MTKLNIRKNIAKALHATADAVEKIDIEGTNVKLNEYRIRLAALIMPSDTVFVITTKSEL